MPCSRDCQFAAVVARHCAYLQVVRDQVLGNAALLKELFILEVKMA